MRNLLIVVLLFCMNSMVYADSLNSLTLTDTEMQKLKKYFPTDDTSHLIWSGDPITIELPINKERRIIFPSQVSIDVKGALTEDQLRILNNDKSIYLTALKPFQTTRIYITLKDNNKVLLVDLTTNENASDTTTQVDIKEANNVADNAIVSTHSETINSLEDTTTSNLDVNYSDLTRFAWQQVYAPTRLIPKLSIFTRAPMHTNKFVFDLVYGDKVIAYPESSWVSGNQYVTVVLIRNTYPHKAHINISKDLCGDWKAASIYPRAYLKPYGDKSGDSAILFLISNHTFGETLGVCHGDA